MNYKIFNQDCIAAMKTLPDNSVDAIVSDPPYELTSISKRFGKPNSAPAKEGVFKRISGGFMGKQWDATGIVFNTEVWAECLRVLKPGGHMLAFGGSRTHHRVWCAIEDAGFEIRDTIMWVYGCLSDDTQIVSKNGIVSYTSINTGDDILCYNPDTGEYCFQPVQEIYEYDISDTVYRVQSDHTDQIVSRNHRCIVERGGRETFAFAETLEQQENIPVLEDLPALLKALHVPYEGTSGSQQVLLEGMYQHDHQQEQEGEDHSTRTIGWENPNNLSSMRNTEMGIQGSREEGNQSFLFEAVQRKREIEGTCETFSQGQIGVDGRLARFLSIENDGGEQSSMEGRSHLSKQAWESRGGEICSMSERLSADGETGRLCQGTSVDGSTSDWSPTHQNGGGSPYQSSVAGQSVGESDVVREQPRSQVIRGWSGHKTSLATITPFHYEGKVWCVKVSTGSFVAVRKGKAFATGNSGFPKSLNISKQIDKMAGAEREVTRSANIKTPRTDFTAFDTVASTDRERRDAPATVEAKQWDVFGTALKPAHEPIVLARKPISEKNVAANVLKWGTGGLNIDGCRIGTDTINVHNAPKGTFAGGEHGRGSDTTSYKDHTGRWPANFIHDGSDEVLWYFPSSKGMVGKKPASSGFDGNWNKEVYQTETKSDHGSAARFFYTAKASTAEREAGLEDRLPVKVNDGRPTVIDNPFQRGETLRKNTHSTVKPIALMRYLVKLVTPPNGVILDPFMGSGTTGCAAVQEGFDFIGCELEAEYVEIATKRIEYWGER